MNEIIWILDAFGLLQPIQALIVGMVVIALISYVLKRA